MQRWFSERVVRFGETPALIPLTILSDRTAC